MGEENSTTATVTSVLFFLTSLVYSLIVCTVNFTVGNLQIYFKTCRLVQRKNVLHFGDV